MFTLTHFYFLVLFVSVNGESNTEIREIILPYGCKGIYIELQVSAPRSMNNLNRYKIQWAYAPANNGDWIGIFKTNPKNGKVDLNPEEVIPVTKKEGWTLTSILAESLIPEKLGYKAKCVDYYAGYFDKCHTCLAVSCLRIEPEWMWNLKKQIGPKKLREVFIPGTHESAWFAKNFKNSLDLNNKNKDVVHFTQNARILGQLIYGTRYLHLTVSFMQEEEHKWWATHPFYKLCPLSEIFNDIRNFVHNTNEIVILDFTDFQLGFNDLNVHRTFIHYLDTQLGDLAVTTSLNWDSTFNSVWNSGKRLIIAYGLPLRYPFLWKTVVHKKFNAQSVKALHDFLDKVVKSPPLTAWSAMAHFFINPKDIEFKKRHGDTLMSDQVSFQISSWYKGTKWLQNSNIVSVDFIQNTGIVRSAIEYNSGKCRK